MQPIRHILSRLFGDALGRDIVTLASGNAIAQILHLIAVPFLMLLYRPSDFGIYAVYLSAVAILAVISALRYDFAILIATSRRSVFSLLILCTGMVGAWCALLELVFIAVASIEISYPLPALPLRFLPFIPLGWASAHCIPYACSLPQGAKNIRPCALHESSTVVLLYWLRPLSFSSSEILWV